MISWNACKVLVSITIIITIMGFLFPPPPLAEGPPEIADKCIRARKEKKRKEKKRKENKTPFGVNLMTGCLKGVACEVETVGRYLIDSLKGVA